MSTTALRDQWEKQWDEGVGQREADRLSRLHWLAREFFSPRHRSHRRRVVGYDFATSLLTGRMSNRYAKLCHCNRITSSPCSQPGKSKAVLDERNINERNPKTNWIDRVHVIRRGEDATRQLPSSFFKPENTCGTFQAAILISRICRKIRYESTILPLDSVYLRVCVCIYVHVYVCTCVYANVDAKRARQCTRDRTVTLSRTSGIPFTILPAFDHQFLIGGVFIKDGFDRTRNLQRIKIFCARCNFREHVEGRGKGVGIEGGRERVNKKIEEGLISRIV